MNIKDIPPDDVLTMTKQLVRAFVLLGCDPECHSCLKQIRPGMKFKLAFCKPTVAVLMKNSRLTEEGTDQMLCRECTPKTLFANIAKRRKEATMTHSIRSVIGSVGSGYTRPHHG